MVDPAKRFSIEGKSVIVTGASGAMGSEAAKALGAAGANVTLAGGNAAALEEIAALPELAGRSTIVARRPDSLADAEAIVSGALAAYGRLDGMLVASGMNKVGLIQDQSVDDWESVMDANVKGSWLMAKAAAPVLIEQKHGSVVLVSSTRGKLGHPAGYSAYCPSKAAVDLLGKTLAAEWGPHQIRVNVLAPTGRAVREAMVARIPLKRFAEPEDFVGALIYLISDASTFMTGQVLYLDGGYTAC